MQREKIFPICFQILFVKRIACATSGFHMHWYPGTASVRLKMKICCFASFKKAISRKSLHTASTLLCFVWLPVKALPTGNNTSIGIAKAIAMFLPYWECLIPSVIHWSRCPFAAFAPDQPGFWGGSARVGAEDRASRNFYQRRYWTCQSREYSWTRCWLINISPLTLTLASSHTCIIQWAGYEHLASVHLGYNQLSDQPIACARIPLKNTDRGQISAWGPGGYHVGVTFWWPWAFKSRTLLGPTGQFVFGNAWKLVFAVLLLLILWLLLLRESASFWDKDTEADIKSRQIGVEGVTAAYHICVQCVKSWDANLCKEHNFRLCFKQNDIQDAGSVFLETVH